MARVAHESIDTTMSSVSASTPLNCLVHLDVIDVHVLGVQSLDLSVSLGILQKIQKKLAGLDWPSSIANLQFNTWRA